MKAVFFPLLLLSLVSGGFSFGQKAQRPEYGVGSPHPEQALSLLKKKYAAAQATDNKPAQGNALYEMGKLCFDQGHFSQALEFYIEADKVFSAAGDARSQARNFEAMGLLFYYNKEITKSRESYDRALNLFRVLPDRGGIAGILGRIGHLYEKQRVYDSAFYYQYAALRQYDQVKLPAGKAKIYENLGSIYEDMARYDSAYVCFNRSLSLYKQQKNSSGTIEVINNIGDVLRKTGKYSESIIQSQHARALAAADANLYQLAAACRDLGKAYELLGRLDSAYHYLELSRRYSLDVYTQEAGNQTAFLQVLYEFNKQNSEIARLNATRKVSQVTIAAIFCIAILTFILGLAIVSRQRMKIREQKARADKDQSVHTAQRELLQLELQNKQLTGEQLQRELQARNRELSAHMLNLVQTNQLLDKVRGTLQDMANSERRDQKRHIQEAIKMINQDSANDQNWMEFTRAFDQVHHTFFDNLRKYSDRLSPVELRLIALVRLNLQPKDIASILGLSAENLRVSRHRLRKKLGLSDQDSLADFSQNL